MVILKTVYERGKYDEDSAYADVIDYIFNPYKTRLDLIGGFAVNPRYAAHEMLSLSKAAGKNRGPRLRHLVLSFDKNDVADPSLAFEIGNEVAAYYADDYQIVFAVHMNRPNLHIHFIMNMVSYQNGKKYSGTKEDFYRLTSHIREVLQTYSVKGRLKTDYGVNQNSEY